MASAARDLYVLRNTGLIGVMEPSKRGLTFYYHSGGCFGGLPAQEHGQQLTELVLLEGRAQ